MYHKTQKTNCMKNNKLDEALNLIEEGLLASISSTTEFKDFAALYNAFMADNGDDENIFRIYDLRSQTDLIDLINCGATIIDLAELYKKCNFVYINNQHDFVALTDSMFVSTFKAQSREVATFILCYPYITECREFYIKFITNSLID